VTDFQIIDIVDDSRSVKLQSRFGDVELMKFVKGPDFPTGGIVFRYNEKVEGGDALKAMYATGRGKLIVQAKAHIEEGTRGKTHIIVSELPYEVNKSALIERIADLARDGKIAGITDSMIFPSKLAEKYRRDDERVMASGKPLLGLIELFPNRDGRPEWFITDKLPLFDREGNVCGLCGTVRSYEAQRAAMQPYLELAGVADHLKTPASFISQATFVASSLTNDATFEGFVVLLRPDQINLLSSRE